MMNMLSRGSFWAAVIIVTTSVPYMSGANDYHNFSSPVPAVATNGWGLKYDTASQPSPSVEEATAVASSNEERREYLARNLDKLATETKWQEDRKKTRERLNIGLAVIATLVILLFVSTLTFIGHRISTSYFSTRKSLPRNIQAGDPEFDPFKEGYGTFLLGKAAEAALDEHLEKLSQLRLPPEIVEKEVKRLSNELKIQVRSDITRPQSLSNKEIITLGKLLYKNNVKSDADRLLEEAMGKFLAIAAVDSPENDLDTSRKSSAYVFQIIHTYMGGLEKGQAFIQPAKNLITEGSFIITDSYRPFNTNSAENKFKSLQFADMKSVLYVDKQNWKFTIQRQDQIH